MTILTRQFDINTDLELAAQVQASFFPRNMPIVSGVDIYATAESAYHVGGDFYDLVAMPSGDLFFAIGDVSYKGMSAALIMAILRKVFRISLKSIPEPTPSDVLRYISADMYEDFVMNGMFATLVVGHFLPEYRTLHVSNAGHSPVIYRAAGGHAKIVPAHAAPLGVIKDEAYEDQALRLCENDLLAVLTDGYPEVKNQTGELFGHTKLLDIIDKLSESTATQLADEIYTEISQFGAGQDERDDQALVIIKGVT